MLAAATTGVGIESVYQPIVDLARATVVGYEALIRFPGYAVSNPETWFAAAEQHHCGAELQAIALRSALANRSTLPTNCFLTVNIAPDVLHHDLVRQVWREAGDLSGLIVELTEHAAIDSYVEIERDLDQLRGAGALLAVDDAGSGYAGLTHLLALRPALIKLDRALVSDIDRDETKRALVEMVGTFAGRIDAWLLAEGIERSEELAVLASLGVPLAQGYYLGRPAPPWAALALPAAATLHAAPTPDGSYTLRRHVEHPPAVTDLSLIRAAFADSVTDVVVLLDRHRRPIAAVTELEAFSDFINPGICFNIDTPVKEAALRAITRPEGEWAAPLLCTDNAGRYVGVVPMRRLIHVIATHSNAAPEV